MGASDWPLQMNDSDTRRRILDLLTQLARAHQQATNLAEEICLLLCDDDGVELDGPACSRHSSAQSNPVRSPSAPIADVLTFSVEWRGRNCDLGPTLTFKLFRRLAQSPNRYLSCETILHLVWGEKKSFAAVKSIVKELRRKLRDAGMNDLAEAIKGRGRYFGLMLDSLS